MIKNKILLLLFLIALAGCKSVKESLSMQKKEGVDEFLIEKKNPLVLPPEFSELPKPRKEINNKIKNEKNIDLSEILEKEGKKENIGSSTNLEKSISNILKKK